MKAASYVIMLAVASATGHFLFTADPDPTATGVQGGVTQTTATSGQTPPPDTKAADAKAADRQKADEAAAEETVVKSTEEESAETSAADKAAGDKGTAAKGSPQRFIPSEQVRADFDVSFPVDI